MPNQALEMLVQFVQGGLHMLDTLAHYILELDMAQASESLSTTS
ncbi:hypothetical protein SAMN02949497_4829 [Methylomagnum ishizawai]|uniref:Uncharacterized protein n=1 Tax=Methylomagnum ishizawai TaxID=1760988 RepID=A0A1Y6DCS5_9GAMM|nr:hypothetical protein [Methylomagnum ishizawai]SMF97854.1 hypothetical protein SAMN02949497_4829 [Methylomagnum ishizawai]